MRYLVLLCLFILGTWGCGKEDVDDPLSIKIMPDKTPYVVGLLEASPDTTHHHPQIFVGYLTDPLDRYYKPGADPLSAGFKHIWSPTLWAQIYKKVGFFHLQIRKEDGAIVKLIGPLEGQTKEIILKYEGDGVYGDIHRQLNIEAEKTYRLAVDYPDGRKYQAETTVPGMPQWVNQIPKETPIHTKVQYNPADKKYPYLEVSDLNYLSFILGNNNVYTVVKLNYENDREGWGLESGEDVPWANRGNYLRDGGTYDVRTNDLYRDSNLRKLYPAYGWLASPDKPIRTSTKMWVRLSQMGKELAPHYYQLEYVDTAFYPEDNITRENDKWDAWANRDTTYWYRISNIKRQNPPSEAISHQKAAGVFGSYSSRYATTTLIPIRDYNLCDYGWSCKK